MAKLYMQDEDEQAGNEAAGLWNRRGRTKETRSVIQRVWMNSEAEGSGQRENDIDNGANNRRWNKDARSQE